MQGNPAIWGLASAAVCKMHRSICALRRWGDNVYGMAHMTESCPAQGFSHAICCWMDTDASINTLKVLNYRIFTTIQCYSDMTHEAPLFLYQPRLHTFNESSPNDNVFPVVGQTAQCWKQNEVSFYFRKLGHISFFYFETLKASVHVY